MFPSTLTAARTALARKQCSALELTNHYLDRIQAHNPTFNAYITITSEQAQEAARVFDAGKTTGLLAGLPLGIKDIFCTTGVLTTAGSHILNGFKPPYESTVTQKLKDAGAVFLGKLNMDEFAMGSANITSYYGTVKSPLKAHDDSDYCRVPGGSSGGSAAALAADLCLAATGTDTGGSIRQPAAFTGTVGLKPTYGRCSRYGIVAFASSLDQAGAMTKTVADAALLLQAMAGYDPKDSTSVNTPVPDYTAAVGKSIKGMKIGIPQEYAVAGMPADILQSWEQAKRILIEAGATLVDISLPHTRYALPCYYIIAPAEASSNLARYDGMRFGLRVAGDTLTDVYENTRAAGFGDEVKRRIMIGTYVLSAGYYDAYYLKAQQVRSLIARDFTDAFTTVDALLTPTTPGEAFRIGDNEDDPVKMYLNDVLTVPASLAGLPAISVPCGYATNGLPLGVQLIAQPFAEETLLSLAAVVEQAAATP